MDKKTMEEYFIENQAPYHLLTIEETLPIRGYIRPHGVHGDTINFLVKGDEFIQTNSLYEPIENPPVTPEYPPEDIATILI
jgi:hypothetical protein